jgi:hypothetical protein
VPSIVLTLNARFREGHASNSLEEAGVLLRNFDPEGNWNRPWQGCPGHVAPPDAGRECEIYGNRLSASIVSKSLYASKVGSKAIRIFSKQPGVVYNPRRSKLNCVYGGDGGTRSKPEDGCGPREFFCDTRRSAHDGWCDGKAIDPEHMEDILHGDTHSSYNEVMVNTGTLAKNLPASVDAIFYVAQGSDSSRKYAEQVHARFLAEYPTLTSNESHPLLCLDLNDLETPFRTSDCLWGA